MQDFGKNREIQSESEPTTVPEVFWDQELNSTEDGPTVTPGPYIHVSSLPHPIVHTNRREKGFWCQQGMCVCMCGDLHKKLDISMWLSYQADVFKQI